MQHPNAAIHAGSRSSSGAAHGLACGRATLLCAAAALLALLCAHGVQANYMTMTPFPFESCKQDPSLSSYSAFLLSYDIEWAIEGPVGSTTCFLITVEDLQQCRKANNFPYNSTYCCDADFNQLKFYPNQACQLAVKNVSMKVAGDYMFRPLSISYQNMGAAYKNQWVHKITPLGLDAHTANGTIICLSLQAPCASLDQYANDPATLEFNLYSTKNGYECCPAGVTPIPIMSLDLSDFLLPLYAPQVLLSPSPTPRPTPSPVRIVPAARAPPPPRRPPPPPPPPSPPSPRPTPVAKLVGQSAAKAASPKKTGGR